VPSAYDYFLTPLVANKRIIQETMNHNFNVIRRHRKPLMVLNFLIITMTLLSITVLADILAPPVWKAKAKFNVPNSGGNLSADLGTLGSIKDSSTGFSQEVNPLETQSTIITSDAVIGKIWEKDPEKADFPALKAFKNLFIVELLPQSTVIDLEVQGSSSELALARANNLAEAFQQRLNELRYSDADSRTEFSQSELEQAKDNLVKAEQELAELRNTTGIVDSNAQAQQLISSINELKTQLTMLQSEAEANQTRAEIAASQFNTTPEKAIQSLKLAENQEYQKVRQQLAQTEIELSDARSKYKDSSPQVQNLLSEQEQLSQELKQRINNVLPGVNSQDVDLTLGSDGTTNSLDMIAESITSQTASQGLQQQTIQIQNQINTLTGELNNISTNKAKLVELERKYNIAEGVYKGIVAQSNRAKIDNFNSYPNVQLIDGPILDPEPEGASKKLIVLGGLLASIFGSVSLVMFRESLSPLLSPKDLKLLEFPILYSLARLKQPYLDWNNISVQQLNQSHNNSDFYCPQDISTTSLYLPSSRDLSENPEINRTNRDRDQEEYLSGNQQISLNDLTKREFERLATIVRSLVLENHRLMITSALAGEGKTTITLGVAIALQKLGFRVLLVDGDLHKSTLSQHLGVETVSTAIGRIGIRPIINLSYGLDLIPAPLLPKEEAAQFFARGNFERYLDQLQTKGNYDYVLVDTPPINLTSESMLMIPTIQNVLFVVKPGKSDRNSVMDSLEQLKLYDAQIKGLILNGVDSSDSYRYGYAPQSPKALAAYHTVAAYESFN
jgi:polysaccharide biosynthesis transport protein